MLTKNTNMKYRGIIILTLLLNFFNLEAQQDKELAYQKAMEAIELMNEGKFDESIELLKESEQLDKENYNYPYEIALAHTYKKEYKKAIKVLKKTLKYDGVNNQVFQLLGNNYSLSGNKKKAINAYKDGLAKFPNSGNLYLEIGNVHMMGDDYNLAIEYYEKGIEVEPQYPSNYYRLSKLFLSSTDKVSGLIYGEIFMTLERTTERTKEISSLLFDTYKASIHLSKDSSSIDFCEIIIDAELVEAGEFKLPFCAIFGKNFILATIDEVEINLKSLSSIRSKFLEFFFIEDSKNYQNVLFNYHKKMEDDGVFDAYNHYLFQISNPDEFNEWQSNNEADYEKFVEWYTSSENFLKMDNENRFIRN